jgi:chromosome segregation ATPase
VALKELLRNDIIGSINRNYDMGNISYSDAASLRNFTEILYNQIYYNQYEELEEMDAMTDESYMTDIDLIIKEQDEKWGEVVRERMEELQQLNAELADKKAELADKDVELAGKDAELADKDAELADKKAKLADRDAEIADKDKEIAMLRKQLQEKS